MRAFFITLACVILSALLVAMMARAPQLGLLKPSLSAAVDLVDS